MLVGGAPADKPARMVEPGDAVAVEGPPRRYVGRGGDKLAGAILRFGLDVEGHRALDAGASTGGFTDCLLQHGAREVVAVDVGYGQLDQRLRNDPRVVVMERTNLRHVDADELGVFDIVVADLSFISLRVVLPVLVGLADRGASLVLLVKPQFEAGRQEVSRGRGVISDPDVWRTVLVDVSRAVAEHGATVMALAPSPLRGADGNVEFLLHARRSDPASGPLADAASSERIEACLSEVAADVAGVRT